MENSQDIGTFILGLTKLIEKPFMKEVRFDYKGFFKLLSKNKELPLLQVILNQNQINFNSGYKVDSNETLERIFKQILVKLIEKDSITLKNENLEDIVSTLFQKIKTLNFEDLIKLLLSRVNLSNFERLKLFLLKDLNLSGKISLITLVGAFSFSSGCANDATHTGYNNTPNTHVEEVVEESTTHGVLQELTQWQKEIWGIGEKNGMDEWYFEQIPNLTDNQAWAFKVGVENKKERWYFELVLKNPNLTDYQALAFNAGVESKKERWYFEQIPNLTDNQAWAFNKGVESKKERRYFELVLENPNLTSSRFMELMQE